MPCVNRKGGGSRAVFTVPPPPPLPGQTYEQDRWALSEDEEQLPTQPTGTAATAAPLPSGNIGGPHGPNLGVNPHRHAAPAEPFQHEGMQSAHSGAQARGGGVQQQAGQGQGLGQGHQRLGHGSPHPQSQQHHQSSSALARVPVCQQHFDLIAAVPHVPGYLDPGLHSYWLGLSLQQRRQLLRLPKKELFARIRALYCSGCFSLVQLQYDELCQYVNNQVAVARNSGTGPAQCPICVAGHACFAGLAVLDDGAVTFTDELLSEHPFNRFEQARLWDLEREHHFSCGEVCGSGWCKRPGVNKCKLHTGPVAPDELLAYWATLPGPRREALMTLDEETFLGELDVSMKLQLRICKECRCAGRRTAYWPGS